MKLRDYEEKEEMKREWKEQHKGQYARAGKQFVSNTFYLFRIGAFFMVWVFVGIIGNDAMLWEGMGFLLSLFIVFPDKIYHIIKRVKNRYHSKNIRASFMKREGR
jgi:hypothetical protein